MLEFSLVLACFAWFVFVVWYTVRAKWWKVPVGRNAFGVSLVLFLILLRITLARLWPGFRELEPAAVVIYLAAAAYGFQRVYQLEKAQRGIMKLTNQQKETE